MRFRLSGPIFYGWWIVAIAFVVNAFGWSTRASFAVIYVAILGDLGWSRAEAVVGYALSWLLLAVFAPLSGWLYDCLGPRVVVPLGGAALGAGLALTSLVVAPWQYYLSFGPLVGFGIAATLSPSNALISRWFVRRRGTALGIVAAGSSFGTVVSLPLVAGLIPLPALFYRRTPQAAVAAGLSPDEFGERLSFFFNAHNHFFQEVAKFRAARRLWAEIMRDRFGATNPRALALRFHAQTGGSTLTAQQAENNVVRVAVQALSAVCGGAQSLHTNASDEALALPTERSARVALRTQQILAHEAGATDTADPLGGAYFIEALTRELEERARDLIERVDELGGAVEAIEQGFVQREIEEAAFRHMEQVESGERVIVGVNRYVEDEEEPIELHRLDTAAIRRQLERTARVRAQRDADGAARALDDVRRVARGDGNLLLPLREALRARCTVGEICGVLREEFGEYDAQRAP